MKVYLLSFVSSLLLVAPLALAQDESPTTSTTVLLPNEIQTNLPGTITLAAPPTGFDPLTASDQDLAANGFPPKPDANVNPAGFETWSRAMSAAKQRIIPKLQVSTIVHGPIQIPNTLPNAAISRNEIGSYNWAGFVNTNATTLHTDPTAILDVSADYVVPTASQAPGTCTGGWAYSSSWVGIDGVGSPDVLQAGSEADAYCKEGATSQFYSAWYEWFPSYPVRVTNLPVAAGNDLYVSVWSKGSGGRAHAFILNYNTGQYVVVKLTAPFGVRLVGNSAEWVVERPGTGFGLTNYASEYFSAAHAIDRSGTKFGPGSNGSFPVVMIGDNGSTISRPKLLGVHALWVRSAVVPTNSNTGGSSLPLPPDGVIEPVPTSPDGVIEPVPTQPDGVIEPVPTSPDN